jgi:histidine triad (HIT) family protein
MIINGEIPSTRVFENDDFIIIHDIYPKARHHYLAIPKEHFASLKEANQHQVKIVTEILTTLPKLVQTLDLSNGYRIIINQGEDAGQSVPHFHIHILGGEKLSE